MLPQDVAAFGDPAREVLVATARPGKGSEASGGVGDRYARVVYHPSEVIDEALADPAQALTASCEKVDDTHYRLHVTARSLVRDLFCMVDKVDPAARIDGGLDTLLAGESLVRTIETSKAVDPAAFCDPAVLRSANDLKRRD